MILSFSDNLKIAKLTFVPVEDYRCILYFHSHTKNSAVGYSDKDIKTAYQIFGHPMSIIVDKQGDIYMIIPFYNSSPIYIGKLNMKKY